MDRDYLLLYLKTMNELHNLLVYTLSQPCDAGWKCLVTLEASLHLSRYVQLTEEALQSEDTLPFKIKAVNQFGVEQPHDLCDEDDNLSVHMSSGKPGKFTLLIHRL